MLKFFSTLVTVAYCTESDVTTVIATYRKENECVSLLLRQVTSNKLIYKNFCERSLR